MISEQTLLANSVCELLQTRWTQLSPIDVASRYQVDPDSYTTGELTDMLTPYLVAAGRVLKPISDYARTVFCSGGLTDVRVTHEALDAYSTALNRGVTWHAGSGTVYLRDKSGNIYDEVLLEDSVLVPYIDRIPVWVLHLWDELAGLGLNFHGSEDDFFATANSLATDMKNDAHTEFVPDSYVHQVLHFLDVLSLTPAGEYPVAYRLNNLNLRGADARSVADAIVNASLPA